jgi:gamma-glutamyl:cysteine ligase YbdK (ATP-grasp superfamily)
MDTFTPRTFSTDWEIMVIDRLGRPVNEDKLLAFAGLLSDELHMQITVDWNALEFTGGINSTFTQFQERVLRFTERAAQVLHEYELDLYPAAAHPVAQTECSGHMHVGTITDEAAGIRLENQLYRFMPPFIALAANSPVIPGIRGTYKSCRVRYRAHGCVSPGSLREPACAQVTWGTDANIKLYGVPTLEIRVPDCPSSRRLLIELAVFVAAFVHQQGTKVCEERPGQTEYREYLVNRWTAAKYGLQATLSWDDRPRPVVEILGEMLDDCADALRILGVSRTELTLVNQMLDKRVCQADWGMTLVERYEDPYLLASAFGKVLRHWEAFDEYLATAEPLAPVPFPDEEAILAAHLESIGEGTHFYRTREAMNLSPPDADAIIALLEGRGAITRELSPERGLVLSRIEE